jgi:hypothetical protein
MSRRVANGLYGLLLVILLVLFWGRLSHWIGLNLQMDAATVSMTLIALIAVCAAFMGRLVRERL